MGLAAAVIILLFAFGTVTAMILPIVSAVLGLVATLALIRLLGHVVEVPSVAPTLATMIGLGVGIDYALFIVTRHKLQLRDGMEMRESVARAAATAGGAVAFAGGHGGDRAWCHCWSADIPLVGTMGYASAVAVVVAVLAAVTLLPALLGALATAHQLAARAARQDPPRRPSAARLGALGAVGLRAALAVCNRRTGHPRGARLSGAEPGAGLVRQR